MLTLSSRQCRARVGIALAVGASAVYLGSSARAVHIPKHLDQPGFRTPQAGEGYLAHLHNPFTGNFGNEWSGWLDIRHPSLAGATSTAFPYDRSHRSYNVRTSIVTDGSVPASAGQANRIDDFNFANRAFMLQSGVSFIETAHRAVAEPGITFPMDAAERTTLFGNHNANNTSQIEVYYAGNPNGTLGITRIPAGNALNTGIVLDNVAQNGFVDTAAHEFYHFAGAGQAIHSPLGADPAHSSDPRNVVADGPVQWSPGMAQNHLGAGDPPFNIQSGIAVVGPTLATANGMANGEPRIGGVSQLTRDQASRMFDNHGATPYLNKSLSAASGDRVDWDFITDHARITDMNGNTYGVEGLTNGADDYAGTDSLYYGIGTTVAPNQAGKDKTGLGTFGPLGDFAGPTFNMVDIFSLRMEYADSDFEETNLSLREKTLDYDVFFRDAAGGMHPGTPLTIFVGGWTGNTFADDYLARWVSPVDAIGVLILANTGPGHDGVTQIDAVIAAVPEPSCALLALGALLIAQRRRQPRLD